MDTLFKLLHTVGYDIQHYSRSGFRANINRDRVRKFLRSYDLPELTNVENIMYGTVNVAYDVKDNSVTIPLSEMEWTNIELFVYKQRIKYMKNPPVEQVITNDNISTRPLCKVSDGIYCKMYNDMVMISYSDSGIGNNIPSSLYMFSISLNNLFQMKQKKNDLTPTRIIESKTGLKSEKKQRGSKKTVPIFATIEAEKCLTFDDIIASHYVNHPYVARIKYLPLSTFKEDQKIRVVKLDDSCLFSDKTDPLVFLMIFLTYPFLFDRVFFNVYNKTEVNVSPVTSYTPYVSCVSYQYNYAKGYSTTYVDLSLINPDLFITRNGIITCIDKDGFIIRTFLDKFRIHDNIRTIEEIMKNVHDKPQIRQAVFVNYENIASTTEQGRDELLKMMHKVVIDGYGYNINKDFFLILPEGKKLINGKLFDI